MSSRPDKELEQRVTAAGITLLQIPPLSDELLALLDQIEELLQKVDQSSSSSMLTALSPLMKALVVEKLLKHSDVDVKAGVACCISEIIRITAPDAPYDDDIMKDVFQLIVSSFENLADMSSRSYDKRTIILETMARVRFCVIMIDLECDQMIIEMFHHFLKAIRANHPEFVYESMETIMTRVLEESENISPDLLIPVLDTLKMNNEDVMSAARKLAERVIQNSADWVRPYLAQTVRKIDADFDDFGKVVASVCRECTDIVSISRDQSDKVTSPRSHLKSLKDEDTQEETPRMCSKGKRTRGTVKDADVEHSSHDISSDAQRWKKKEGNRNFESSKSSKRQKMYGSPKRKLKDTATESGGKSKDDAAIIPWALGGESQNGKTLTKTRSSTRVNRSGITLPKTTTSSKEPNTIKYDNSLVGLKVKVWWSYYERFYEGVIASFDNVKRKHKVCYDDGDVEDLNLRRERWEFVDDDSVSNEDAEFEHSRHDTSSDAKPKQICGGKSKDDGNYVDDAAIKLGGESQNGKTLSKASSSPKVKESGMTLPKTTSSSSKGGDGNSIWPTEGTLHHQAIKSTLRRLSQMLDEGINAGVTIITSDGSLKAHKPILSTSSPIFRSMFRDDLREKVSTVEMKEMTSESCTVLLSFLYGSLDQEAFLRHRLDLLAAAKMYGIVDLKDACEHSLLEDINSGNVLERLQQAWLYKMDKLKKGCFDYLLDSEKIHGVREMMNEFFKQADRGLLVDMFEEVFAVLKRS